MKTYMTSFSDPFDYGDTILFGGVGGVGAVYRSAGDTITTVGSSQTVNLSVTGSSMALVDSGQGLTIGVGQAVAQLTVSGFQSDPTGRVVLGLPTALPSVAPDGAGGTMLTVLDNGGTLAGTSVDFVGDPSFTLAQVSGGDPPTPPAPSPVPASAYQVLRVPVDTATMSFVSRDSVMVSGLADTMVEAGGQPSVFYDQGSSLGVEFSGQTMAPTMVWGAAGDPGVHVDLLPGQTATQTSWRDLEDWGTQVTVSGGGLTDVVRFADVAHVAVGQA